MRSAWRAALSSPANAAVSLVLLAWLGTALPGLVNWAVLDAVWHGDSPRACAGVDAACWLFVRLRLRQILMGGYPASEQWRVLLSLATVAAALLALALPRGRHRPAALLVGAVLLPVVTGVLLRGGLGLAPVPTARWGGLMLTAVIALWTIASTLPAGLALALARRSQLPIVAGLAALYIDLMRGLPLVGILFVAVVLFPLFVPPGVQMDELVRVLLAFSLFNAANMAEAIRGGLQAVPLGQYEAARALGLGHWRTLAVCILPQALRAALPGIINVSIAIIKETTIVLIAGLFDLLGVLQAALIDPDWLIGDQVRQTAYFFAGLVFFLCCFLLSQLSARLERRLGRGQAT